MNERTVDAESECAGIGSPAAAAPPRKKAQTPYKPRLATLVKNAMEDSVRDAVEAQELMGEILAWLDEERTIRDQLHAELSKLAPLDHRVQTLVVQEIKTLARIGKLENRLAKLALVVTALERRLMTTLVNSRRAAPSPQERRMSDTAD